MSWMLSRHWMLHLRAANATRFLVALPTAVLRRVLEHADLQVRVSVSETCSALRTASLAMHHLWSHVSLPVISLSRAAFILQRSHSQPARLRIRMSVFRCSGEILDNLDQLISMFSWRLEYLHLRVTVLGSRKTLPTRRIWDRIATALSSPAPLLQSLHLGIQGGEGDSFTLRNDFLGGVPGRLRSCWLNGVALPSSGSCSALSAVTTFDYIHGSKTMELADLEAIAALMPHLETFGFSGAITSDPLFYYHLECLNLRRAALGTSDQDALLGFVQYAVRHDALSPRPTTRATLPAFVQSPSELPATLRARIHTATFATFQFGPCGQIRVEGKSSPSWLPLAASPSLVSLVVHEQAVESVGALPCAPNLTYLRIVLASRSHRYHNALSIFIEATPLFDYPALRVLRISHAAASRPVRRAIALSDVSDLIRHRLRFAAPRLERLVLSNIHHIVDVDLAKSLEKLHGVVTELEFDLWPAHDALQYFARPTSIFDPAAQVDDSWARFSP